MNRIWQVIFEAIAAGTFGALAMMPPGFLFRALEMRVGHYGPKFASLYLDNPGQPELFLQHLVLGWISALPLCALALRDAPVSGVPAIGAAYGVAYYILVNSLALPIYFGDPLPWQLGVAVIIPSLVTHIVFGAAVALGIYYLRSRWRTA